ncbi:hypothetical protein GPECTOR_313g5 [Gonium pectorale]|uniref:SGNH hydrolase-type esterase domain-containing protein n=1 Tax=Gonium pectorale TaxID=33097 RepID=A0A150FVQ9_GONPE|nr:hypothetical protein GPECTOR_313g5 [Gonium pectorale]|eukprot:KXZ41703.1 hypothetical protein GPECTOR_313g5 [Gonium pectorale]
MERRLPELLRAAKSKGVKFSWVLIMGGINDIRKGDNLNATRLFEGLQSLYAACHAHGARVLAMTVLQKGLPKGTPPEVEPARQRLNELIRGAAKQHSDYITLLDTDKLLPFPHNRKASPGLVPLWDGTLHLSAAGYDRLGELVFAALRDKLPQAKLAR